MRSAVTPRPVFRIVHLETWNRPASGASRRAVDPGVELDRLAAALAAVEVPDVSTGAGPLRLYVPALDEIDQEPALPAIGSQSVSNRPVPENTEPVGVTSEAGDQLPEMRVRFARRRQQPGDRAFGRVAELEANLERLVAELEAEVDRLEDASSLAVQDNQPGA